MSLDLMHRRLVVSMGLVALAAFSGGAGFEPISAALAGLALMLAFFWQPDSGVSMKLERFWLPVAAVLVVRSLYHWFLIGGDVVIPVVDLLLLLLCRRPHGGGLCYGVKNKFGRNKLYTTLSRPCYAPLSS